MAGVVVMNYHGYLVFRGGARGDNPLYRLFDPWTGPLSTRFAATFVLTAGVGVTLMTRSSIGDRVREREMSWRLVRRGLLLYGVGIVFNFIWNGTILPFYGAMFVLAALMFRLRIRWLVLIGTSAAAAGWLLNWWVDDRFDRGVPTRWLTDPGPRSPTGLIIDVMVNGTHPLLPWLAFFCAGIILGRLIGTTWWRPAAVGVGLALYSLATVAHLGATGDLATILSDDPFDRGLVYTASALGTALLAFAGVSALADRFGSTEIIKRLQGAGQLSLTIYLAHALVFNLLVDWLDVVTPGGIAVSLSFALIYWVIATIAATEYQRRYGRGPAETVYRHLTA